MITLDKETYLVATEAAKHLRVSRVTFYKRYRSALQVFRIGRLRRPHYRLSELEIVNRVEPLVG